MYMHTEQIMLIFQLWFAWGKDESNLYACDEFEFKAQNNRWFCIEGGELELDHSKILKRQIRNLLICLT